jgi:ribonuclease HI
MTKYTKGRPTCQGVYNKPMSATVRGAGKKYYVVWKGRKTGVYTTWDECAAQVNGFTGAQFKAFPSRTEAEQAYQSGPPPASNWNGPATPKPARKLPPASAGGPLVDSYCVDAACSGNPGVLEYRGVYLATRKEIFHQGPFQNGTNNIGEFLAIVHILALLKTKGLSQPVYTDSHNAMLWVKVKRCRTKLQPNTRNAPLFELIARAEEWLKANSYETRILKWDTEAWGEIPADFGRK